MKQLAEGNQKDYLEQLCLDAIITKIIFPYS